MRRLATLLSLLAVAFTGLVLVGPSAQAIDRDCSDFATQKDAQLYFLAAGGPAYDPSGLDRDGDGIACDSNPCPCYYSTSQPSAQPSTQPKSTTSYARIIRVIDGDTVKVRLSSGARRTVRMLGLNSPEVYGTVECYGPQASATLKKVAPRGTKVRLISDPSQANKDRYGRLLRYVVKTAGSMDLSKRQIRLGSASVYYPVKAGKRASIYRSAQAAAQAEHRGMWGVC